MDEIFSEQTKHDDTFLANLSVHDGLLKDSAHSSWIPDACYNLQLPLGINAHAGPCGYSVVSSAKPSIRSQIFC